MFIPALGYHCKTVDPMRSANNNLRQSLAAVEYAENVYRVPGKDKSFGAAYLVSFWQRELVRDVFTAARSLVDPL